MVCKDTLRIKHLPKELTDVQKEDFVRHFGACKVKVITSKAKAKSIVYAKFENEDISKNVMSRLHQINILNCRLSVEYAETDILQGQLTTQKVDDVRDRPDKKFFKNFINNINAFNDSVGFYQPPPSHLKYNYPKANRPTINNIAHALATVPRFYTQVLHLMNKMNLPPPFAMPEPPVRTIPGVQAAQHHVIQNQEINSEKRKAPSSSESEMESDGEASKNKDIIPEKRTVVKKKTLKRPKFIKQQLVHTSVPSKPVEKAENVFDKVDVQPQRKIELKVIKDPVVEKPEVVKENIPLAEKKIEPLLTVKTSEVSKPKKLIEDKSYEKKLDVTEKVSSNASQLPEIKTAQGYSPKENLHSEKLNPMGSELLEVKPQPHKQISEKLVEPENVTRIESAPKVKPQSDLNVTPSEKTTEESILQNQTEGAISTLEVIRELQKHDSVEKIEAHQEVPQDSMEIESHVVHQEPETLKEESTDVFVDAPSSEDECPYISLEELAANQVTDLSVMPVFKNYNAGDPTNKLYIKNCAKTVVVQDLEYIYNRYREEATEEKPSEFNIRLMQEGRMKGQAFVTLDSVEQAQKAVKETNGFILKDKPLVVVFGKAGKKK